MGTEIVKTQQASRRRVPVGTIAIGIALIWSYWPLLATMAQRWSTDSRYSHGYLVPAFAVALLWIRRERLANLEPRARWWGVPLLALGGGLRLAGAYFYLDWVESVSLLPCLAGLCVLGLGAPSLRWSWPAIAFLLFMVPLPYRVELAMGWPLQRLATEVSTYTLQTLGLSALSEGNIIYMNEATIGVVEACSGLSMMLLFFALSTAVTMLSDRPWLDRILIVASAAPIAMVANIVRIVVTGVLHETVGDQVANIVFHDLAGWLMMPLALGLLGLELLLLSKLLIELPAADLSPRVGSRALVGVPSTRERSSPRSPLLRRR